MEEPHETPVEKPMEQPMKKPVEHRYKRPCPMLVLVVLGLFALSAPLQAHVTYMPASPEVRALAELYSQAGMVFPSASFPLAKRDLVRFALELEDARPRMTGQVGEFLEMVDFRPGEVTIGAILDIDFQSYLRSSGAQWINADEDDEDFGGKDTLDFYRRYLAMPDFLSLALHGEEDDTGGVYIRAGVRRRYERGELLDTNFLEFHPDRLVRADNYFIRRGYWYHYLGDLDVTLGRNALHLGAPGHSTFMASDRLPHVDALSMRYRLGPFQITSISATLDNRRAQGEPDTSEWGASTTGWTNGVTPNTSDGGWPGDRLGFGQSIIYYGVHRLDYTRERVRLGVASQQFVARENNAFHLGDIFPVFSWHNTDVGPHNMSLIMDISWAVRPGVELHFQAGYNDIDAEELAGIPDDPIPTIDAYLGAVSWNLPWGERRFRGTAEVGYTHFLWGNFYDYNQEKGNYLARGVYRFRTHGVYMMPMTSPYGPGVTWTRWNMELAGFGQAALGLDVEILSRKDPELVNLVDTVYDPEDNDYSVYEDASRELIWRVAPRVTYTHPRWGSFFLEPSLHGWEDDVWAELTLGGSRSLRYRGNP